MTQPRTSPIHRLAISPLYFTPAFSRSSSSLGSSIRIAVKFAFPLTAAPSMSRARGPRRRVTSCDPPLADRLLELAVGERLARLRGKVEGLARARAGAAGRGRTTRAMPGRRRQLAIAAAARLERRLCRVSHPSLIVILSRWRPAAAGPDPGSAYRLLDARELQLAARRVDADRRRLRRTPPAARASRAHRARAVAGRASTAARRRPGRTPSAIRRSFARSVSSTRILRSSSRFISPRSWMSMIARICSRRERVEDDDLVEPVQELRAEVRAQRVHAPRA